ncbi:acyl carrier protein [Sorangium sp. So ce1078]|uniref:acyl carrier protein n=1 Tax=Sorangium sp. So ce1078 TaxID=3133329 RepID=UPI003F602B07
MPISELAARRAEAKVRAIVARLATAKHPEALPAHADLFTTIGISLPAALVLLVSLEDEFDISIPDGAFIEARTVAALVALVAAVRQRGLRAREAAPQEMRLGR